MIVDADVVQQRPDNLGPRPSALESDSTVRSTGASAPLGKTAVVTVADLAHDEYNSPAVADARTT